MRVVLLIAILFVFGWLNFTPADAQMNARPVAITKYVNTSVSTGEIQGSTTASICPTISAELVMFKALISNTGKVYVGTTSGVTKADGTTDATTGIELGAGETTGWIPATNVNKFYRICDNATDDLTYMAIQQ